MKNKYLFLAFGICLTVLASATGCQTGISDSDSFAEQTEYSSAGGDDLPDSEMIIEGAGQPGSVTPEMIYEARCPYIGEAPAVGRLSGLLKSYYGIAENSTMELQTTEMPYGMTLHFERKPDNIAMQKMAAVLLQLIENCSAVTWDYPIDEAGNREAVYFSYGAMESVVDAAAALAYTGAEVSSEDSFWLLSVLEEIREVYPAVKRETSIEEAVGASIISHGCRIFGGGFK